MPGGHASVRRQGRPSLCLSRKPGSLAGEPGGSRPDRAARPGDRRVVRAGRPFRDRPGLGGWPGLAHRGQPKIHGVGGGSRMGSGTLAPGRALDCDRQRSCRPAGRDCGGRDRRQGDRLCRSALPVVKLPYRADPEPGAVRGDRRCPPSGDVVRAGRARLDRVRPGRFASRMPRGSRPTNPRVATPAPIRSVRPAC